MDREKPYRGESNVLRDWARRQCGIWRFDAIEDRAVYEMLVEEKVNRFRVGVDRVAFWGKYHREREAYLAAVTLCLKWGRNPTRLLCL